EGHSFSLWKSSEVTVTENTFTMPDRDVTVEAIFSKNIYKVTYISEGSTPVTKTVEYGEAVSLDNPFEKDGYEFEGWLRDGEKVTSLTMPAEDITLNAVWKERTYKIIRYEFAGVTVPDPYESGGNKYFAIRADKGETIYIDRTKIKKEGYTFKDFSGTTGTSVSLSYGSLTSKFEVGDADIVIKGTYEGDPQKLYTNRNYNSASDSYQKTIRTGEPIGDVSAPSRSDYDFVGWAYDSEGNFMYSPDDLMPAKSVTLYAIWREKPWFTVSFSSEVDGFSMDSMKYREGDKVSIDDFSYPFFTGYTYKGLAASDSEVDVSGENFTMPARDVEIRVLYDRNTVRIRCKVNDDDAGTVINVPYGELIRDYIGAVSFEKQTGWSYDWIIHYTNGPDDTLTDQTAKDGINQMKLNAYKTPYKLTLTGPDGSSSTTKYYGDDISGKLSSFASSLTTTVSEFSRWETADGNEFTGTTMPLNDLKLTAITKDRYYTFTFLENEGDETGPEVRVKHGDPLNVPPFSKAGYSITSWNSVNYKNIQLPLIVTKAFLDRYGNGNNDFHPTWTLNSDVKVTYIYGGTSVQKKLPMGADVLSHDYVKDIIGEYDIAEKQLDGIINGDSYQSYKANSDTEVTLKLTPRTYTVSCYVYLDSSKTSMRLVESMSVPFGSVINTPERPAHSGYEFTWLEVPSSMPAGNIRIYGLYTPIAGKVIVHKDSEIDLTKGKPDYTVLDVTSSGCVPELPVPGDADGKGFVMYISKTGVGERTDVWAGDSVSSGIELYPVFSAHRFELDRETKTAAYLGAVAPSSVTEVNIPSSIMMYTVTGIADRAFAYYSEKVDDEWVYRDRAGTIRKVTVPSTVTTVGEEAFYRSGVETVEFESGSSTVSFRRGAFSYAKKLRSVKMPDSYTLDGSDMFLYCESLKNFTVPSFITVIPKQTFAASGLETVVISEGVERIEESAFYMADNLGSVVLPSSLKSIGDYAFSGDVWNQSTSSLFSVTFREGLEEIGVCAFRNTSAEEYKTPNSVKRIGTEAFSSCKKLERVYLGSSLEMIYDGYDEEGKLKDSGGSLFARSDKLSDVFCNFSSGTRNFGQTLIDLGKRGISPTYNHEYSL
ncbi:MAG: leucine-rich repeat protein, partial [Bullifex sp.]